MSDDETNEDPLAEARRQVAPGSVERPGHAPGGEAAGDVIDRYKLLEEIGEGGMGTVWMAEQTEPVKRLVALKIIKLGMDTREVVVRFEAERQALALMDHPHIATVLDGGATEAGRPYFVMELVKGVPITEYCDAAGLGLRARLELFGKVCEAVQHAHHKGVVHRDIKPSNVMVTLHDGRPVPKVIDFGVAKATSAELTQKTMFTQYAAIVGTPEYMAPEQAELSGLDVDTRADVYSLGVLLYELLTGTKPFEMRTVLEAGYQELLRTIREVDPAKPSTRVSTLRAAASPIAGGRAVNVEALSRRLRGDLDWIVMKALEKDRTRRYDTAIAFAADVGRYLTGEPVEAAPPSALYRARKLVARRRKAVGAAAAILVLFLAGAVGTGVGLWRTMRANEELDRALGEKSAALEREAALKLLAEEREREARVELARADEVTALIEDLLRSVTPQRAKGADVEPFTRALEQTERRLSDGSIEDPRVRLQLRELVGVVYYQLGLYEQADRYLPAALDEAVALLGADHPKTHAARLALGLLHVALDRDEAAERELRGAYDGLRARGDAGDPTVVDAAFRLATFYALRTRPDEALAVLAPAGDGPPFEVRYERLEHRAHARLLASVLTQLGRYDEVEPLCDAILDACAGGADCSAEEIETLRNLRAYLAQLRGDAAPAAEQLRATVARYRVEYGEDHPDTLGMVTSLATKEVELGRFAVAEELLDDALARATRALGPEHRTTLKARYALAWLCLRQGRLEEAEERYAALLAVVGAKEKDDVAASVRRDLASVYQDQGRFEEAEPLLRAVLDETRARLGDEHPQVLALRTNLAVMYNDLERYDEAARQLEISLPLKRRLLGEGHPWTLAAIHGLGVAYRGLGRADEALPLQREALELRFRMLEAQGASAPPGQRDELANELLDHPVEELRDPARALLLAETECALAEREQHPQLWRALTTRALAEHRTGDPAKAAATQERALELAPAALPAEEREELEQRLEEYRAAD